MVVLGPDSTSRMNWWKPWMTSITDGIRNNYEEMAAGIAQNRWVIGLGTTVIPLICLRMYCTYTAGRCHCTTNLNGKVAVITGGNAGIGKATAMRLARHRCKVIIASRNAAVGTKAVEEIKGATRNSNVEFRKLDLGSFESVRNFARELKEKDGKLHILINNAGVTGTGSNVIHITEDNCEHIMQCNYFGHFLLTLSVLDMLKANAPSRIVNVSSMMYKWAKLDLNDLNSVKTKYNPAEIYNKSKLAMVLFTIEMAKRLQNTGVTINVVHPGIVETDLVKNTTWFEGIITRILFKLVGKSPEEGAETSAHLALAPELKEVSGAYYRDCKEENLGNVEYEHMAYQLYRISEKAVKWENPRQSAQ